MTVAIVAIVGVALVVAATTLAPKVGVATPLLLVLLGFLASLTPWVGHVGVPPELVLEGILPPLLYSAAVSTPIMEVRRDFRIISLFSVVLVVASATVVGLLATVLIPGLPLGVGLALGAVISPTDPVATSIVRKAHVSSRLVTVLDGESMLNDASALVLLRAAIAAVGVSVSVWQVAGQFVWAVVAAIVIGYGVGKLNLLVRAHVSDPNVGVAVSLVVPFLASVPAERIGASGLVAAVAAGFVTGYGAPHRIGARDRLTERTVWSTIELLLESGVFLLTGLELRSLTSDLSNGAGTIGAAVWIAAVCVAVVLAVRAVFVAWSVWSLALRNRRAPAVREELTRIQDTIEQGHVPHRRPPEPKVRRLLHLRRTAPDKEVQLGRWRKALDLRIADLDYLAAEQFGWRDGVMLTWSGLRGAVTVAAVQTLPVDAPSRSLVVLVAVFVAIGTLLVQGSTLSLVARLLGLSGHDAEGDESQWVSLQAELSRAALARLEEHPSSVADAVRERLVMRVEADDDEFGSQAQREQLRTYRTLRLDLIAAEREALLSIRQSGTYPSALLDAALAQLDAEQIGIELRR